MFSIVGNYILVQDNYGGSKFSFCFVKPMVHSKFQNAQAHFIFKLVAHLLSVNVHISITNAQFLNSCFSIVFILIIGGSRGATPPKHQDSFVFTY